MTIKSHFDSNPYFFFEVCTSAPTSEMPTNSKFTPKAVPLLEDYG